MGFWLRTLAGMLACCEAWRKNQQRFVAEWLQGPQRWRIPSWSLSCLFSPISGRADEAESLPSTAHQLHTQNCENHQVPWLGASFPGETPSDPGPGAQRSEDLHPPLLRVSGVLPSVYISGDVILVSLLTGAGRGHAWGGEPVPASLPLHLWNPESPPWGSARQKGTAGSVPPMCFNRWHWSCLLSTPWWQRTTPWMQRRRL